MNKPLLRWLTGLFVVFLIIVIIIAGLGHGSFDFVNQVRYGDKLGHLVLMGLLSLLVNLGLNAGRMNLAGVNILKGSAVVWVAVTMEECSQLFLIHRQFDFTDLAFDYTGIFLFGRLAAWYVAKRCTCAEI